MRIAGAIVLVATLGGTGLGQPVSQQIGAGDTALIFGGADAEGGIGDWYVSNGIVQAIVDDAGPAPDLVGVVPAGQEPPIQSEINPTGGTIIDLGVAGRAGDELPQFFTVGGLSTSFFILYDTVSAPAPGTIRATGKLLLPPASDRPDPCIDVVTDYTAVGSDPFLTVTTTQTNNCAVTVPDDADTPSSFLDAIIWTQRGIIPFSAGASPLGGRGFDHPALDFANLSGALEIPSFAGAPGMLRADDGVMDPANGTGSEELSYGLWAVHTALDADGPGGADPVVTPVVSLFGVSSPLVTALGATGPKVPPGGSFTYVRRLYVGATADVRSVSNAILPEIATRDGFSTGTISGDVDAADMADVTASIVVRRLGRCAGNPATLCKATVDCGAAGLCSETDGLAAFGPGSAITHVRTDATGAFSGVVLPVGVYELVVSSAERDDVTSSNVVVAAGVDTPVTVPALGARGAVAFAVREKAKRRPPIPAKLVFKGVDGTPDPRFHKELSATLGGVDLQPETFGGSQRGLEGSAFGQGNVVYTATGTGTIAIRPGTYDVYASRGGEYGVARRRVTVASSETATVDVRLKRVIRPKDTLSADFHVHSGRSLDSSAPLEDRVVSFAAEGVEVMISTDHDKHLDYGPVIASLGLSTKITAVPGVEVTGSVPNPPAFPNSIGHINAWPMPVDAPARRDGSVQDEYVAPNWVFKRLRDLGGADTVIQYNHPRAGVAGLTSIGFFNSIGCGRCANAIDTLCTLTTDCPAGDGQECACVGFQPDRPLEAAPNDVLLDTGILGPGTTPNPSGIRNIDFDVMEIANGAKVGDYAAYLQMRDDWFALLGRGMFKPGTGVSDSHRVTVEHAGWARTYVLGTGDDPAALDIATFNANVKAGRMVASAGPWIEVTAIGHRSKGGPGDTVASRGGTRLKIDVRAPAWMPVDEVRVVRILGAGNVDVKTFDATTRPRVKPAPGNFQSSGGTSRFRATVGFKYPEDHLVLVEAGPKLGAGVPTSPEIVNVVEPEVVPLAFTNPVLIDARGDGFALPVAAAGRQGPAPGRMTGVSRAARADAVRRGDYFPIYEFRLTAENVARALGPSRP